MGRGKGSIKESVVFEMAYPMIVGVVDVKRTWYPILNALQSHHIFESIKKIVELEKIRVILEPQMTSKEKANIDKYYLTTSRQDTMTAGLIKTGVIKIHPQSIKISYGRFSEKEGMGLLRELYGLDDGVIKNRWEERRGQPPREGEHKAFMELRMLRAIWDGELKGENAENIH